MGHVPYVGFATYRRATVRARFTFCIKKKKNNGSSHIQPAISIKIEIISPDKNKNGTHAI